MFLLVHDGPHAGRCFETTRGPLTFGPVMPPAHVIADGEARVEERGGKTYLDDRLLMVKEEFRIGGTRITVHEERPEGALDADHRDADSTIRIDLAKLAAVTAKRPWLGDRPDARNMVLAWLLEHELLEHGLPDPLTGAKPLFQLRRGLPGGAKGVAPEKGTAPDLECKLAFLAVDVLNLKLINDRQGNLAGDRALIRVAAALQQAFPRWDTFRMHGDGFLVLAPSPVETFGDARKQIEGELVDDPIPLTIQPVQLTIVNPYWGRILPHILEMEFDRALFVARHRKDTGVQHRHIDLQGRS